jgi:hypothetical protein
MVFALFYRAIYQTPFTRQLRLKHRVQQIVAVALINGKAAKTNGTTDNGVSKVPSVLLTPVGITKSNVKVVIADGFQKKADVCKGIEALCTANGIK